MKNGKRKAARIPRATRYCNVLEKFTRHDWTLIINEALDLHATLSHSARKSRTRIRAVGHDGEDSDSEVEFNFMLDSDPLDEHAV